MIKCLFIGGPADGQFLEVEEGRPYWEILKKPKREVTFSFKETIDVTKMTIETIVYVNRLCIYDELFYLEPNRVNIFVKEGLNFGFG